MSASEACAVAICERPVRARGWCQAHYYRWNRTGDLRPDVPIDRPVGCCVEGCDGPHSGLGYCEMHYQRIKRHGSLDLPAPTFHTGTANPQWKGDEVGYKTAHRRVRRLKGRAWMHLCWNCGSTAREWAYDHADELPLTCSETGRIYSGDPEHYVPLCSPCHHRIDNAARRGDLDAVLAVMVR